MTETKQNFVANDEDRLRKYLLEEKALHHGEKIICILANTKNSKIRVWKSFIDTEHLLKNKLRSIRWNTTKVFFFRRYRRSKKNDREKVLKNAYAPNETLHKKRY